jgi:hypothetical protein
MDGSVECRDRYDDATCRDGLLGVTSGCASSQHSYSESGKN